METSTDFLVPVTQFRRPNGAQTHTFCPVSSEKIETMAFECIDAGARFTAEILMTGIVSLACEYKLSEEEGTQDIAIELCPNDESVGGTFEKVVRTAHKTIKGTTDESQ